MIHRKITIPFFPLIAGFILISQLLCGQDDQVKKYSNRYDVTRATNLVLVNKYGNIDIKDWDRNEVSVEVTIVLKDVSSQKAAQIFDKIDIQFTSQEGLIKVETLYDEAFFNLVNKDRLQNKRFEVNYQVSMPDFLKVDINNRYGDVFISRLASASLINVRYGSVKINEILAKNKDNMAEIDIAYSKGNIENAEWLKVIAKYSQLSILESKALIVVSKYSKIAVEKGSSLICESKYDTYDIGRLANLVTEAQYSNFRCGNITRKIDINTKYTDVRISNIPAGFEEIKVDNRYGSVRMAIAPDASYHLKGYARYAKINYPDQNRLNRVQESTETNVEGIVGSSAKTKSTVRIETHYGGVSLY